MTRPQTGMRLIGVNELKAALAELPNAIQKRAVREALSTAAQPVADLANQKAPGIGNLRKSYSVTARIIPSQRSETQRPGKDGVRVFVGANYSKAAPYYAPHAHLVEFGTGPRYQSNGKFVGQTAAQPHLRPAWEQSKVNVVATFGPLLGRQVELAAARVARRNARAARRAARG